MGPSMEYLKHRLKFGRNRGLKFFGLCLFISISFSEYFSKTQTIAVYADIKIKIVKLLNYNYVRPWGADDNNQRKELYYTYDLLMEYKNIAKQ